MAGQLANKSSVLGDIHSTRTGSMAAGVMGSETSAIGGEGRRGGAATGGLSEAPKKSVLSMMSGGGTGMANGGKTGYNSGSGRTL